MRRLFRADESGLTRDALKWAVRTGRITHIGRDVYAEGGAPATPLELALAPVIRSEGAARGRTAGVVLGLDSVKLQAERRFRTPPHAIVVVEGIRCGDGLQTMLDLAGTLTEDEWEQALESALRKRLVAVNDFDCVRSRLIRRVMARRGAGVPPTESLLETLMVQLCRQIPDLPPLVRQYRVGPYRLDLALPDPGVFFELDGEQHKDQPVYDAFRETAVVAATGWPCGRFTWSDVNHRPNTTKRRVADIVAKRRRSAFPGR